MSKKKYQPPSKIAARVYKALQSSNFTVLTEVDIGERLRVDFVVREISAAIEADGNQHQTMNGHFFDGKDDFRAAKARDQRKAVLCEQNGLTLIRLSEQEIMAASGPSELLQQILQKLQAQQQTESEEW